MMNIDTYKDEHEADKRAEAARLEREAAAQAEKERKEYAERAAEERRKRAIARWPIRQAIVQAMRSIAPANWTFDAKEDEHSIIVDGVDVSFYLSIEDQYAHQSRFSSRPLTHTGYRIVTGQYGNRTSFPQKKDGSHSYLRIAENLMGEVTRRKSDAAMEAARKANNAAAAALAKELGLPSYSVVGSSAASAEANRPIMIDLNRLITKSQSMSVDKARVFLHALRDAGFIVK